jgi:DNA topoisomerase VI subunit B
MDTYGNEDILHVSLPGTLSTGQRLALHHPLCLLLWLICEQGQPRILNVQQLTSGEAQALVPLLQSFPAYAPYALVLASIEESSIEKAQERLNTAWLQGEEA